MSCKTDMSESSAAGLIEKRLEPKRLKPIGRLQFFFHSPSSDLPVRDVCNEQGHGYKTEPHLERNAENYMNKCCQVNIQGLRKNDEKYLFLFTTCRSRAAHMEEHEGERYIVGYIRADRFLSRGGFDAVQGETKVVAFKDAYRLDRLDPSPGHRHLRMRKLNAEEMRRVLNHLRHANNIKGRCIREIKRLSAGRQMKGVRKCR
jgi:hypothetical protein